MYFKSPDHRQRVLEITQRLSKQKDAEFASALYLLTATAALWDKASGYVSEERIEIPTMLAEQDLSGGYSVLVTLAGHLFNGRMSIEPLELLRLDPENFQVALTAILIRREPSLIA